MKHILLFVATLFVTLVGSCAAYVYAQSRADVAVVLAVDVSSSVSEERFKLQRQGIAEAITSDQFRAEMKRQTIELAVMEWSGECNVASLEAGQREGRDVALLIGWTVLRGDEDAEQIAEHLRSLPRSLAGCTNVGLALHEARNLFESVPLPPDRKVIDVSGDGSQNEGKIDFPVDLMRAQAIAAGITINGLPIFGAESEPEKIDDWYQAHVVGGPDSFMIVAKGFDDFGRAMRHKLTLEVALR